MSRPEGPIKYRASCDGCYLAKLKCSKEKPTCPRCKNLGLTCTYSPSQRTGKHRATKSQASSSCSTTTATTLAATTTTPPPATAPAQVLAWQPAVSSSVPASAILPIETLTNPFDKHPFPPKNDPSLTLMDTPMSDWSGSATTLPDLDSNLLAPWRNYLPNADQDDFQFDILDDFPSMIPPAPDQKPPLDAPPPPPTPPSSHTTTSCNCFASITQALHELHAQSRRPNRTPALEATLSGSKEVTARGEQLLRCRGGVCASDGSLIMLFAALLSKYLSLYAANTTDLIVSSSSSSSSSSTSSSSSSTSPPSPSSSSSSCCADVFPSRVTIGTYTMDVEDGERLRMEIVLMELQKLNALLGRFRGKVACSSSSASSCVGVDVAAYEYEGHTYETVLDFLNTRLKEAMNRLQRQKQRFQAPGA